MQGIDIWMIHSVIGHFSWVVPNMRWFLDYVKNKKINNALGVSYANDEKMQQHFLFTNAISVEHIMKCIIFFKDIWESMLIWKELRRKWAFLVKNNGAHLRGSGFPLQHQQRRKEGKDNNEYSITRENVAGPFSSRQKALFLWIMKMPMFS